MLLARRTPCCGEDDRRRIMSRAWAERHGVQQPQDFNAKQETHAVRNANGTGPFVLKRYEPDARTVLAANPNWWGRGRPSAAAISPK